MCPHFVFKIKRKSKLSLFKANVKFKYFKKLKIKFTRLARTPYKRLKHATSFVLLYNIFKFWTIDYRSVKNLIRFEYFNNIFLFNYYVYSYNYLRNNNESLFCNVDFVLSNINKTGLFNAHPFFIKQVSPLFFKNASLQQAWFYETPEADSQLYPFLMPCYDRTFFALTIEEIDKFTDYDYNLFFQILYLISFRRAFEFYIIFTLVF